jgi:hypothetical protein
MFSPHHFAQTLEQILSTEDRVAEHYEALLQEVDDSELRLALLALRQDVQRRIRMIHDLLGSLGK